MKQVFIMLQRQQPPLMLLWKISSTMDSIDSEASDAEQCPMEDCGFMDPEVQHIMRTNYEDTSKYHKYGWVDLTHDFKSACGELNLWELAQDMLFGLFKAMSAIEMVNPKMDVGVGCYTATFELAVEEGVFKLNCLTNK